MTQPDISLALYNDSTVHDALQALRRFAPLLEGVSRGGLDWKGVSEGAAGPVGDGKKHWKVQVDVLTRPEVSAYQKLGGVVLEHLLTTINEVGLEQSVDRHGAQQDRYDTPMFVQDTVAGEGDTLRAQRQGARFFLHTQKDRMPVLPHDDVFSRMSAQERQRRGDRFDLHSALYHVAGGHAPGDLSWVRSFGVQDFSGNQTKMLEDDLLAASASNWGVEAMLGDRVAVPLRVEGRDVRDMVIVADRLALVSWGVLTLPETSR